MLWVPRFPVRLQGIRRRAPYQDCFRKRAGWRYPALSVSPFAAHHDLAERAAEIVRAAEQEAARLRRELDGLRQDAEGEAHRHLAVRSEGDELVQARMRRVRELIAQLIEQTEVV